MKQAARHGDSQFAINWEIYHSPGIDRHYTATTLSRAETVVLLRYQPRFADRDVLDLGVGTGRTIAYLKPLARRYVCLDYSRPMVDHVRSNHPDVDVRWADMRDLSPWRADAFDFVFATSNVLDAVSHRDRLKVLSEVRRVLTADGVFVFSSHNRAFRQAGRGPQMEYSRNPITQVLLVGRYLRCWANHRRTVEGCCQRDDYALFDDPGHDFGLIHYYITSAHQTAQLDAAGFQLLDVVDGEGRSIRAGEDGSASPSLMYVARRR
ncbi:MAG TPA: class I SAM-dependent methyltransferase [Polyangia bacterium]|nr:class I SAM-dependent methyltransferase [Polyangia bacterium]